MLQSNMMTLQMDKRIGSLFCISFRPIGEASQLGYLKPGHFSNHNLPKPSQSTILYTKLYTENLVNMVRVVDMGGWLVLHN